MAMSAEHKSNFAALQRQWWRRLQMSENSRMGLKTPNKKSLKVSLNRNNGMIWNTNPCV